MVPLEKAHAAFFGRRFCRLTNRGTTALTAAFHSLALPPGAPVVFPAAMCSIPVFAASFAGFEPLFADVNLSDGNFDLDSLESVIKRCSRPGIVVPVHMFGKPDALDQLKTFCDRAGWALVEDCALSMGATHAGLRVGGFGRISCFSFVRKMVPLEMGGAVLTDDPVLDERLGRFISRLPVRRQVESEISNLMKEFHRVTAGVAREGWGSTHALDSYGPKFREQLLLGTTEADWENSILLEELERLDDNLKARQARSEIYEDVLKHERIIPLDRTESSLFAFPVRLNGIAAEDFIRFAEREGVSFKRIAYPDIHRVFPSGRRQKGDFFGNARVLERELIGMPVDEAQPVSSYWGYAESFIEVLKEYLASDPKPFNETGCLEERMG
jgi:dTDP-4-amino-4,6-dideoxygalactose transaminase